MKCSSAAFAENEVRQMHAAAIVFVKIFIVVLFSQLLIIKVIKL